MIASYGNRSGRTCSISVVRGSAYLVMRLAASVIFDSRADAEPGVVVVEKKVCVPIAFTFSSKAFPKAPPKRRAFVLESSNEANDRGHDNNHAEQITHKSGSEFGKKRSCLKAKHASASLGSIDRRPLTRTVFF